MFALNQRHHQIDLGIVKVETVRPSLYEKLENQSIRIWESNELVDGFNWADMCFASSGTVTLATGLFQLPTVVAYKLSLVNEFLLRLLIPYKGPASLTNIIHGKMIFPEVLQYEADRYNIAKFAKRWLESDKAYDSVVSELEKTKDLLSGDDFSTAEYMAEVINESI